MCLVDQVSGRMERENVKGEKKIYFECAWYEEKMREIPFSILMHKNKSFQIAKIRGKKMIETCKLVQNYAFFKKKNSLLFFKLHQKIPSFIPSTPVEREKKIIFTFQFFIFLILISLYQAKPKSSMQFLSFCY